MRTWGKAFGVVVTAVALAVGVLPAAGSAESRTGPALSVPEPVLRAALACSDDLGSSDREPVLLVPGTTLTPDVDFGWNYERAFAAQGQPWCAVRLPDDAMSDIQTAAEYVVFAVRSMNRETGREVQIVGHSQGGMVPRWMLKFWPDTRAAVDDVIGLAPSNHGTVDANVVCQPVVGCAPAIWQQRAGSAFYGALNSDAETYAGISYTNVFTALDEIVVPNLDETGASSLHTGAGEIANIGVQSVCPGHVADHLSLGTSDPVGYAAVIDALRNPGPAQPARLPREACARAFQPGVNPATFSTDFANLTARAAAVLATSPHVPEEPPLQPYAQTASTKP